MTKTLREETITLVAKKLEAESGKMIYKEKEFPIGKMTRGQFEEELSAFLSDGWEKHSIGFDMPASLINWHSDYIVKSNFFKAKETLSDEGLIAYELWLLEIQNEYGQKWDVTLEEFEEQYYGCFKTLEDYAQHMIEEWDRSNLIPIKLSGRIKPSDVLLDKYYMKEVTIIKGPSLEDSEVDVVYILHSEEYYDRMDG